MIEIKFNEIELDDMSKIMDHEYINKNVLWSGTNNQPPTRIKSKTVHHWVYYDEKLNEIKEFDFDNVVVNSFHCFAGTQFDFYFVLGEKGVIGSIDIIYAPNLEELKEVLDKKYSKLIEYSKSEITRLEERIKEYEKIIGRSNGVE
jgi:hypothetical protein